MKARKVFYWHSVYIFGVWTITSDEELTKNIEQITKNGDKYRFWEIEYIKGTEIGATARRMNQCYGGSKESINRNKYLLNNMYHWIMKYGFKEIV